MEHGRRVQRHTTGDPPCATAEGRRRHRSRTRPPCPRLRRCTASMRRAALAAGLLLAAALAAAPAAALSLSLPDGGIPPGFAGVWVEERAGVDGGPAMVLSRQWLPDGNGFVMYTQVGAGAGAGAQRWLRVPSQGPGTGQR